MKRYEIITPESEADINKELYEYCLCWFNRYGAPVQYMFTDWEANNRVSTTPINNTDPDKISSLIDDEVRNITLTAENIDRSMLENFKDLIKSPVIFRVYRIDSVNYEAGGFERLALVDNSIQFTNSKQRFNVEITLKRLTLSLWK